ncbi:MAG: DNA mismatch repair endonuclease MutL [Brevinemataceae bacterium]
MSGMEIQILDPSIAMKIAAGEVIDKPASVVRELIDNSIDAGAGVIRVELEKGGREFLSVYDDGSGMDSNNLKRSYLNHSTSKIISFDDLMNLKTFGFRGEALASIAEIAALSISSCTRNSDFGSELKVRFGEFLELAPKGMNHGTIVTVTEFFQNVPARLKFLNSDTGEYRAVVQEFLKKALGHPDVSFALTHNNVQKYFLSSATELFTRIVDVFPELTSQLHAFSYEENGIHIYGFLSHPSWYKPTRSFQYLFINRRAVEWPAFRQQISLAYNNQVPPSKFPAVFCYIDVDPALIDFNVHPQKKEVRFENERTLSDLVRRALRLGVEKALMADISSEYSNILQSEKYSNISHPVSTPSVSKSLSFSSSSFVSLGKSDKKSSVDFSSKKNSSFDTDLYSRQLKELYQKAPESSMSEILKDALYVGTIFNTFLIFQYKESLYLVDFHAMHERIRYEKLIESKNQVFNSQKIIPTVFQTSLLESEKFEEIYPILQNLGFMITRISMDSFSVEAVPAFLEVSQLDQTLRSLFEVDLSLGSEDILWDAACKTTACRGSVKAGDALTKEEIEQLIQDWSLCSNPASCPHGRPIVISLSKSFFDKEFKRTGF